MFEQPAREALPTDTFWRVQFVFDNDAMTEDFAYTVGLADHGLPELHIMAAPRQEFSDSPWVLSAHDCASQLNQLARMLIDGGLTSGDAIECTYDGGTTTVVWTPGDPTTPDVVQAYCADPSATVIPITAQLLPAPVEQLADLTASEESRWRDELEQLLTEAIPNRRGLRGFHAPKLDASFYCGQEYGPLTPLVRARAHAVSQATPDILADLLVRTLETDRCFGSRAVLGIAYSHAKLASREPAAWSAEELAVTLVKSFRGPRADSPTWRSLMALTGFTAADDSGDIRQGLSGALVHVIAAMLVATTVVDRLDEGARLAAFGPWSSARLSSDICPDHEWWAPRHIVDRIRSQVEELTWDEIDSLVARWDTIRDGDLMMLLRGLAVTGRRACPPASDLLAGSLAGVRAAFAPDINWHLSEFLCCATALLSERANFSADDVHKFCGPLGAVLPHLETSMNSPIVEQAA